MKVMNTIIYKIDLENIQTEYIEEAGRLLLEGELVAIPTETVYGLGGDAFNDMAIEKIYKAASIMIILKSNLM